MQKALDDLLNVLCVEWGFCIDQEFVEEIQNSRHITADDFARSVLEAEGMNPELETVFRRKIRKQFSERFGNELSEDDFNNAL